uniref:Neurotransmitter-gated ion-channel ligand-binding domain-containing protein n=1 Tax=Branchiostoma floridae TaxID=7739 RepID=C3YB45_BRAFL|eukprot:XP_002606497.1 hypothetical protein BRAFLDRAFT_91920 [Branchiostoma floridae]
MAQILQLNTGTYRVTSGSDLQSPEEQLITSLMQGYNTDRRPVRNVSDAVNVTIDIAVAEYLHMFWTDPFLTWDPSEYNGLDLLRIQGSKIWSPDILLYNSVFDEGFVENPDFKATIRPDGSVAFLYPFTFKAACRVNIVYFPEDIQVCPLKFGSWSYDGLKVDLVNRLLGFLTPPESGERMTMVLTALLANTVNMEVVAGQLPKTSSYVPIIGKYFGAVLFVNALAIAMNVVILSLHFGSFRAQPPPAWLKTFLRLDAPSRWADWFFWRCFRRRTISFPPDASGVTLNSCIWKNLESALSGRTSRMKRPHSTSAMETTHLTKPYNDNNNMDPVLLAKMDIIVNNMRAARMSREEKRRIDEALYEWREVASRIDRIFFAIFTVIMLVVNIVVFGQI